MSSKFNLREWLGFDLEKTFRLTAEVSSLILILGFIVSATINQIVFVAWGFNFLALASPADVLMAGMGFALDVVPPLLVVGLLALGLSWYSERAEERPSFPKGVAFVTGMQFVLGLSYYATGAPPGGFESVVASYPQSLITAHGGSVVGLASGAVNGILCLIVLSRNWRKLSRALRWVLASISITGVGLAYVSASSLLGIRQDFGYHPAAIQVIGLEQSRCDNEPVQLLWSGSENIVARCVFPREEVFVVPTNAALAYEPFKYALPMCDPPRWPFEWKCWKTR